ncbi:MAG: MerC family mercury resistance protein [Verrucomicrobia subdivision 3 bacterium]|nr:MerC family mercury resistance protein [Limisphaerales bacterium]
MSAIETASPQPKRIGRVWLIFDKLGAVGAVLAAIAAPCCFPLFATIAGALGLGSVPFLRGNAPILIQAMTALAFVGQIASYRQHRKKGPLLISGVSASLVVVAYLMNYHVWLIYAALAGLTIAAIWNLVNTRRSRSCCPAGDMQAQSRAADRG